MVWPPDVICVQHRKQTMMTSSNGNISPSLALCEGNPPVTGGFLLTKSSNAELWCFLWSASELTNWANSRDAGDLRRHCAHHDVTVMDDGGVIPTGYGGVRRLSTDPENPLINYVIAVISMRHDVSASCVTWQLIKLQNILHQNPLSPNSLCS